MGTFLGGGKELEGQKRAKGESEGGVNMLEILYTCV
jgi:hypothetical protein